MNYKALLCPVRRASPKAASAVVYLPRGVTETFMITGLGGYTARSCSRRLCGELKDLVFFGLFMLGLWGSKLKISVE